MIGRKLCTNTTRRISYASNMRLLPNHSINTNVVQMISNTRKSSTVATIINNKTWINPTSTLPDKLVSKYSMSSMSEPEPTLFKLDRLNNDDTPTTSTDDIDKQLRADVKTMGSILGKIISETPDHLTCLRNTNGKEVFQKVETLRSYAKAWRQAGAGRDSTKEVECNEAFDSMSKMASSLSSHELITVSRAFMHFCAIANAAEYHHRSRKNVHNIQQSSDEESIGALGTQNDSCGGVIPKLLNDKISMDEIYKTLTSQQVELVLTAHPTEVNRRTLLDKHRRVQELLTQADTLRDSKKISKYQMERINTSLEREIALIWQSDEVSREKPTPQNEAKRGTLVVETVLWETVPNFLRKLDATMKNHLGEGLPLTAAPFKFSSWMGGDRDGNPNVTPNVTREVCYMNRMRAANLLAKNMKEIAGRLSTTYCSDELRERVGANAREPYRAFLTPIVKKLELTAEWAKQGVERMQLHEHDYIDHESGTIELEDVYLTKKELLEDLLLVHKSLDETGNELCANGYLLDTIRALCAFGLTLVPLDIRQESTRHTEALDAITRYLGIGSYSQWDESTKLSWLQKELSNKRPLINPNSWRNSDNDDIFSETVKDTLEIFQMVSEQHDDSLNAYVISQAKSASDVLAVLLLQLDAGVKEPLRVVPLFETLDDLNNASGTMNTLFNNTVYRGYIHNKHEVMIGYSDSAKDAGRLAASWAQYKAQEELANLAVDKNIDLTFFHGKGGTVGRGGNPATFNAILSHAPNTINGTFRVTEQGEMINQNFGHPDRAERTLDIYTAAVCAEQHTPRPTPTKEWRTLMNRLSDISCDAYRSIVREDPRFVPYFRSATPELELSTLNIGSRPAKRKASGGVESLRAIPWIFAWTQTRLNLPTWLGVGEAIKDLLSDEEAQALRDMYNEWGSFRTTVDLVEMVLAKSEPAIACHYDNVLVHDDKSKELGEEIRKKHALTEKAVLDLTNQTSLSAKNEMLKRLLHVRNPYVDCMNVLQVEILKRLRECSDEEEKKLLMDALRISITGIANGMGNTG